MDNKLIGTKSQTQQILQKYNLSAKKKYGQNFLVEPSVLNKIAGEVDKSCDVIEIGAGIGALTEVLALNSNSVTTYEIDNDLIEVLHDNLDKYDNVTIINEDFLKAKLPEEKVTVVSNLPYYITSDLLVKLFTEGKNVEKIVAMMQKEVAKRFTGKEKGKDYSTVQVLAEYYCDVSSLMSVSHNNFIPAPHVDSEVLIFKMKKDNRVENEELFCDIIKTCYSRRRKVILSNLNDCGYQITKQQLTDIGISETARVEQLTIADYLKIYEVIENERKGIR